MISSTEAEPEAIGIDGDEFGLASYCTEGLGFESSNMMINTSCHSDCCSFSDRISEDYYCYYNQNRENKRSSSPEKKDFPPPLTSLIGNGGRRSFALERVRSNGRLEIRRVSIDRPEILLASRQNGRLRLHLVSSDDEDEQEMEKDVASEDESPEEDQREWNIPAIRRCNQKEISYAWSPQQSRCVTTM